MKDVKHSPMPVQLSGPQVVTGTLGFVSPAYHSEVVARLQTENKKLRAAAVAFSKLVTCHKIGRVPSENLFKELEEAHATLKATESEGDDRG